MDQIASRQRDFEVDLENGGTVSVEDTRRDSVKTQAKQLLGKIYSIFVDGVNKDESEVNSSGNDAPDLNGVSVEQVKLEGEKARDHTVPEKKVVKEKRKKMSNKKTSPKPPRPPRGPSLDAADQKLIKEITELSMLKRARVERMKALKKMKAAKGLSSSSNVFATAFTFIFCLVILFQAMSSRVTPANLQGSPISAEAADSSLIAVQYAGIPFASDPNSPLSGSPIPVKQLAGLDHPEGQGRAAE